MKTFSDGLRTLAPLVVGLLFAWQAPTVQANGCGCPTCAYGAGGGCGGANEFALVERMVRVPQVVTERRVVNVTEYRTEQRQRTVNVSRLVPETRQVTDFYTVMVPEVRHRTEKYHVQKPVWREVEQAVTVQVPYQEQREGVRQVCRQVRLEEMRTIHKDHGKWEDVFCEEAHGGVGCGNGHGGCCHNSVSCRRRFRSCDGCGGCGGCGGVGYDAGCGGTGASPAPHIHRVWRPNVVAEQVPVTVWRTQMVEEPYRYTVTVYRPVQRVNRVKVCEYVTEEKSRDVAFTVCVPQQRERVRRVTTYKSVSEPRVETYAVRVPYPVAKEVNVQVCQMVEKKVVMRVPVYYSYGGGGCAVGAGGPCGPWCP